MLYDAAKTKIGMNKVDVVVGCFEHVMDDAVWTKLLVIKKMSSGESEFVESVDWTANVFIE